MAAIPDDDAIVASPDVPVGKLRRVDFGGLLRVGYICKKEAALKKAPNFKVLVSLTGGASGKERPGLDVVTVLDVSESMANDNKLNKLMDAMCFLIKKLSPVDRLSVVTFNTKAEVQPKLRLRPITEESQKEIEKQVRDLVADGRTNIAAGLTTGLEVLKCRKHGKERSSAIMLMSDGDENINPGSAAKVIVGKVPVYTFGFGKDHKAQVLTDITKNGGTFSVVDENLDNLSHVFAQSLAGLLTVVVEDLKLTVTQYNSTVLKEVSGAMRKTRDESTQEVKESYIYPQNRDDAEGSITVSFGNLYSREVRNVIAYLDLPAVTRSERTEILLINYKYRAPDGNLFCSPVSPVEIDRTEIALTDKEEEEEEVTVEEMRLSTAESMHKARLLADKGMFEDAKTELRKAEGILDNVIGVVDNPLIEMLKDEVKLMIDFTRSQDIYYRKGKSFAMSSEICHGLQRYTGRGDDIDKLRFFTTPRMDEYLAQSKKYLEDKKQPVPTVEEDVKKELEKDPLASIAGPLCYYIQSAKQSLKAIEDIITNNSGSC